MTSETTAKKNIQKLQRAIVDGLEDVKAQDIVVFNTEHLSPLFERVIVASGTSNRQTKALAASVRDAVREAGFDKPRTEGEDNGEWIIVDCGAAVAHIMQPAIRQYYRLEEIWGDKPVRLKHGADKGLAAAAKAATKPPEKTPEKAAAKAPARKATAKTVAAKAGAARTTAAKAPAKALTKAPAKKAPAKTAAAKPAPARKPAAKKAPVKVVKVNAPAKKAAAKKVAAKPVARKAAPARKTGKKPA